MVKKPKPIFLDYAASTPLRVEAAREMRVAERAFGNPSSLHSFGQAARAVVDRARERVAAAVGAGFREIVFTGSATEANNLALRGTVAGFRVQGLRSSEKTLTYPSDYTLTPKIIVSAIEHESVLETALSLERSGEAELAVVPVSRRGVVDVSALERVLDERTALVSVIWVNNETGTIQPIAEISNVIRNFRNSKLETLNSKTRFYRGSSTESGQIRSSKFRIPNVSDLGFRGSDLVKKYPLFHVDAAQAFAYLDCDVGKLGVNLMTLSGHKLGGPKGIGALFIRNSKHEARNSKRTQNSKLETLGGRDVSDFGFRISDFRLVSPIVTGGGQEFGIRSGTENVPLMAGFAEAVAVAVGERERSAAQVERMRILFLAELRRTHVRAQPNVPLAGTAPHILNLRFPGVAAEELLVQLDLAGVAVSAGSACAARAALPSHVLLALGMPRREVEESVRVSFGTATTAAEVREAARRFAAAISLSNLTTS